MTAMHWLWTSLVKVALVVCVLTGWADSKTGIDLWTSTQSSAPSSPPTAAELIEKGRDAIKNANYGGAEKELKRALKLLNDSPEANLLLAVGTRRDRIQLEMIWSLDNFDRPKRTR
jgi:hypothetical protein